MTLAEDTFLYINNHDLHTQFYTVLHSFTHWAKNNLGLRIKPEPDTAVVAATIYVRLLFTAHLYLAQKPDIYCTVASAPTA